ncbi:MAG: hypothetical protein DHS20C16_09100 [Phycisphaerae bacterium]|nr:MAG: hypothetical protein DHS20C16_09100 [Phycisphaerae bacterium]
MLENRYPHTMLHWRYLGAPRPPLIGCVDFCLELFDQNEDNDIDLADLAAFTEAF